MNKKDLEKIGLTEDVLEKAGIGKDVLDKIIVLHGQDIESHKTKITTLETENGALKTQLGEAGTTIEKFKGMNIDQIQKSADDYKAAAEKATSDAAKQIGEMKFDQTLKDALLTAKAKNPTAVRALLKVADLKIGNDGTIIGLSEQLEKVKTENDYLFTPDAVEGNGDNKSIKIVAKTNNQSVISDATVIAARKAAGLSVENK